MGCSFFGLRYLAESLTHEWTDDAFLDANVISIAPKVAGQVKRVHVKNNQAVKAGDLLVEIDPRDLAVQLDQKRAAVESARANVVLLKAAVELSRTQVATRRGHRQAKRRRGRRRPGDRGKGQGRPQAGGGADSEPHHFATGV